MTTIYCPECEHAIELPAEILGASVRKVRCGKCGTRFEILSGGTTMTLSVGEVHNPLLVENHASEEREGVVTSDADEDRQRREALRAELGHRMVIPRLGLELVWISPGEFVMGSPLGEEDRNSNERQHDVQLTTGFWLGKYAVTQGEFESLTGEKPSEVWGSVRLPVESVSWDDAMAFCDVLNREYGTQLPAGYRFCLPTEAQWEYSCRAGTTTPFSYGRSLNSTQANFDGNYPYGGVEKGLNREKTIHVGRFVPNAWGLFEMHGNVWEWCFDWSADYRGEAIDPSGLPYGRERIIRGGCWQDAARSCRSARRNCADPETRISTIGFRLAVSALKKLNDLHSNDTMRTADT